MNITIIGTTAYQDQMADHKTELEMYGHVVSLPAFDNFEGMDEYEVCDYNRKKIEWADEVHVIWVGNTGKLIGHLSKCVRSVISVDAGFAVADPEVISTQIKNII